MAAFMRFSPLKASLRPVTKAAMALTVTMNKKTYEDGAPRPGHHKGKGFANPWPSFVSTGGEVSIPHLYAFYQDYQRHPLPEAAELPKVIKPDWGNNGKDQETLHQDIKATWLGHACFLVEFPSPDPSKRGLRVLFDPVFSYRCSPSQWVGPGRYTPPPIPMSELPQIDVCVLSHNHHDHADATTLNHLYTAQEKGTLHFFVPLKVKDLLTSLGIEDGHISDLDWWDSAVMSGPADPTHTLRVICTPAQHFSGRGIWDRDQSLWATWAVEQLPTSEVETSGIHPRVWFGGDTGYRTVPIGVSLEEEEKFPPCPEFQTIGEKFGGFDFAMIPIGGYAPRHFFSRAHSSPEDAVCIHRDVRSRKSLGMHWGTWKLTSEEVNEPKRRLAAAVQTTGKDFTTAEAIGATVRIKPE